MVTDQASTLDDVLEATRLWHMHRVHVHLGENQCQYGDSRRNEDVSTLAFLAELARSYEPCDVVLHGWPPELLLYKHHCSPETLVSNVVVCGGEYEQATTTGHD